MLVTFKTEAHADIIMFGDVALLLLKMMGHSPTVPGALLADQVPQALARLKEALHSAKAVSTEIKNTEQQEPPVSITRRALPLIELLITAVRQKSDVMWK